MSEKEKPTIWLLLEYLFVFGVYIAFAMVLPHVHSFYDALAYPSQMGVFSIYLILMLALTLFAIGRYGYPIFKVAYESWRDGIWMVESLVTIGSLASFVMAIVAVIQYHLQIRAGLMDLEGVDADGLSDVEKATIDRALKIGEVIDYLETSALILLFLQFGQYFVKHARGQIRKMTDQIFPEDLLVKNTVLQLITPRNRRFDIEHE